MAQAKHGCSFEIVERGPNNSWQTWLATCTCKERWTGENYAVAEDKWRIHVHQTTGRLVQPAGDKNDRWAP
jgi:hypothetical protein